MEVFGAIFSLILGSVVGSFLNVVILRQGIGKGRRKRSICLSCGEKLNSRDLVPILSFFWLKGRCRFCKSKISWQYPLVEIFTGALFGLSFWYVYLMKPTGFAIVNFLFLSAISSVLMIIFVYDLRHKIISDWSVIVLGVLAFSRLVFLNWGNLAGSDFLFSLLSGFIVALPFFLFWFLSRGRWMGLGDSKLMLGLGWFLGWSLCLPATALAFWIGAIVSIFLILVKNISTVAKKFAIFRRLPAVGLKTEVPFAPFLIFSALFSFFFNFNVFDVISRFFL